LPSLTPCVDTHFLASLDVEKNTILLNEI